MCMLRNYLNIAYRSLFKNKAFSFINILGLAVGMAAFLLSFNMCASNAAMSVTTQMRITFIA